MDLTHSFTSSRNIEKKKNNFSIEKFRCACILNVQKIIIKTRQTTQQRYRTMKLSHDTNEYFFYLLAKVMHYIYINIFSSSILGQTKKGGFIRSLTSSRAKHEWMTGVVAKKSAGERPSKLFWWRDKQVKRWALVSLRGKQIRSYNIPVGIWRLIR